MRIGCLQFAPQVGDIENNLNRADAVLSRVDPMDIENLDLLVLPEMAFSGYNFKSLQEITPFVEPSGSGISSLWARTTALKYDCTVAVGYPERVRQKPFGEDYYNSLIVVNGDGETVANYRKSSLYYTDETWASEGSGFYEGEIQDLGKVAMGICMDINPYKFETPWTAFEFGFHILEVKANLVIISMAWLTNEDARTFTRLPSEPDMETLTYWVQRLEPVIRAEGEDEVIVIFANRCGVEGDVVYAGTSTVLGIQNGEVSVYGLLGRGAKELLVVNTEMPPFAKLVNRPEGSGEAEEGVNAGDRMSEVGRPVATSNGQKSPVRALPCFPEDDAATDSEEERARPPDTGHIKIPNRGSGPGTPGSRGAPSPREDKNAGGSQNQPSPEEAPSHRRTASPRDGYSPKESPVFRRTASPRDGYSPREEHAPRSQRSSPSLVSSRDRYSPGLRSNRGAESAGIPSPRDLHAPRIPSPRQWSDHTDDMPHTGSFGRNEIATGAQEWSDDALPDLASPTFPEPTPMSARPKLAISTGPETLPPRRAPPAGVRPGNFFSSRDLCTPPETPFDYEPQSVIQQYWVPPSAFTYTPEEPEWPATMLGADSRQQLPARRPSPANVSNKIDFSRTPARTAPTRPSSRTREVKLSDLDANRDNPRHDQEVHSGRAKGPDRRGTPAVSERETPRLRNKRSQPAIRARVPAARDDGSRGKGHEREERHKGSKPAPGPVQNVRDSIFPWNAITIAASPSVFKTEFQRSETFPRGDSRTAQPKSATGWETNAHSERNRLKRSKSISAFQHDPTNYLPSPALPVHKAYQAIIYSAIEPAVSVDRMWAAAAASHVPKRKGSASSDRGAAVALDGIVRPDIMSPMSV